MNYYVKEDRDGTLTLFTYYSAIEDVCKTNPGTIFPQNISEELLTHYGYIRANINYLRPSEYERYQYYLKTIISKVYKDDKGYQIDIQQPIDYQLIDEGYIPAREDRDRLLLKYDWVITSNNITSECKDSFNAWRQVLRDIFNIGLLPHEIVLPNAPAIVKINNDIEKEELSEKELDQIKNINLPADKHTQYTEFLMVWHSMHYHPMKQFVLNLWKMYLKDDLSKYLA